ncbi:MAG: glycosyltransferase family 2 protein [Candidatus Borkfalkia sp.]
MKHTNTKEKTNERETRSDIGYHSVYNAELYLEKCIESVLGQTFDALEVICDDGSSDASVEILRKFQNKDERLIVLRRKTGSGRSPNGLRARRENLSTFWTPTTGWILPRTKNFTKL